MTDDFVAAVSGIGALAEPVRRRLYLYAAAQPEAVSREQAAAACGVPLHTAKFHLDRLAEQGLLAVEHRRVSGRSGPGAGRPAKLYRRSSDEISVSLPDRSYDLAAELLARAVEHAGATGVPVGEALDAVASDHGRAAALEAASEAASDGGGAEDDPDELALVAAVLARHGYEPFLQAQADGPELCLRNCPFDQLARHHTELVCGMNLALVDGLLDGLGCENAEARLHPDPELCCVRVH